MWSVCIPVNVSRTVSFMKPWREKMNRISFVSRALKIGGHIGWNQKQNRIGNVQANCELFEHRTSVYKEYLIIRYLFSLITQNYLPSFQEIRNETTLLADIQEPRSKTFSKQLRHTSHFVLLNVTNGTFFSDGLFICRDYSQNFKAIYLFSSRQMVHSWVARVDLVTPGSKISTHSKHMYE